MRHRLSLDGPWEFATDPDRQLSAAALSQAERRPIQVPGPWQAQFADLRDYTGVAWYRLTFTESEAGAGQDLVHTFGFGAVDYHASVCLNGVHVGEHEGGYLPFELDVTSTIRTDSQNELIVRVID